MEVTANRKNLSAVGQEILSACRAELTISMPYLSEALGALTFIPGDDRTVSLATDGESLFYNGSFTRSMYLRGSNGADRTYLHIIFHCLLRHVFKKKGRDSDLWDLACDAAVESILDSLDYRCLTVPATPAKQLFYSECRQEMPVLTAEGIYLMLLRQKRSPFEIARLQRLFLADDHGLWDPEENRDGKSEQQKDENWKSIASHTQTAMQTVFSEEAQGGEAVSEQVRVAARDDVDFRAFLRRFAAPREILRSDEDAFDYTYYTYGLQHYGNMPLIEPPETKEEKRIEDFVIAVDTSMSTSGDLVRAFLGCTYSILRSTETFTRRLNIHVLQCDDRLRSDTVIHDFAQLKDYMDHFTLTGGSATDFRPVFDHVRELTDAGAFHSLRGLLYFTDGMGRYPTARPPYETAFVLIKEPPLSVKMPPWAIRIQLDLGDLTGPAAGAEEWQELMQEEALQELPDL